MDEAEGLAGVRFLDHTADVGIDVEAATMSGLFHRAAGGMLALLRGEDEPGPSAASVGQEVGREAGPRDSADDPCSATERTGSEEHAVPVSGQGRDWATVLAAWLRELLFLHETEGLDYRGAEFTRLEESGFEATVRTERSPGAVREIKGVTYHELAVEETRTGWRARVIFDV